MFISKHEAESKGLRHYFTGKACKHGHTAKRRVSNSVCTECENIRANLYYRENTEKCKATMKKSSRKHIAHIRARNRKFKGFPDPTRPCPEACEVCGNPEQSKSKLGNSISLSLDHCHATGKFRGWLCYSCNTALGKANDSPELLEKLAQYLRSNK